MRLPFYHSATTSAVLQPAFLGVGLYVISESTSHNNISSCTCTLCRLRGIELATGERWFWRRWFCCCFNWLCACAGRKSWRKTSTSRQRGETAPSYSSSPNQVSQEFIISGCHVVPAVYAFALLVFLPAESVPERFLKALLVAIEKSPVTHFQVSLATEILLCCFINDNDLLWSKLFCPDSSGSKPTAEAGEVCRVLTDHHVAVRVGGVLNGLATPTEGYVTESTFVAAVLE